MGNEINNDATYEQKLAQHLLDWMRNDVFNHFSQAQKANLPESTWISGYLNDDDIRHMEFYGHQIKVSVESGETFYKILFYKNIAKKANAQESNVHDHQA